MPNRSESAPLATTPACGAPGLGVSDRGQGVLYQVFRALFERYFDPVGAAIWFDVASDQNVIIAGATANAVVLDHLIAGSEPVYLYSYGFSSSDYRLTPWTLLLDGVPVLGSTQTTLSTAGAGVAHQVAPGLDGPLPRINYRSGQAGSHRIQIRATNLDVNPHLVRGRVVAYQVGERRAR